jgi:hypothetical protein
MAIDKLPSGAWRVRIWKRRRVVASSTFKKRGDAVAWQARQIADVESRRARGLVTSRAFRELADDYLQAGGLTKSKSDTTKRAQVEWWRDNFGHVLLADFDHVVVGDGLRKLREKAAQTRRNYSHAL